MLPPARWLAGSAAAALLVETVRRSRRSQPGSPSVPVPQQPDRASVERIEALEEELRRERARVAELEHAMGVRDDFIAVAGHELRTPLTVIQGYAEELADEGGLVEPQLGQVQVVVRRAALMSELVDDLFDLAKLDAGLEPMVLAPLQLDELVRDAVAGLRRTAKDAGVRFRVSARPLVVAGDDGALRRMVGNLLSNAVKYSPEGGLVTVNLLPEDDDAVLVVSDSGIGIPADELERVFERLFRASNAVAGHFPGTGLGLAIARSIVETHGGRVHADAGPLGGARVTVRLPLAAVVAPSTPPAPVILAPEQTEQVPETVHVC